MAARQPATHNGQQEIEAERLGIWRVERFLDQGHGKCLLQSPESQDAVEKTLLHSDGHDYWLGDYAIMPNHVHVLVRLGDKLSLAKVAGPWRSVSAHRINKRLGRRGTLWQEEPFDHVVRDDEQLMRIRLYIQNNSAKLPPGRARVGCGALFKKPPSAASPPVARPPRA